MKNIITKRNATLEQLVNGEYEVDGVMGGQGRSPESLIEDSKVFGFMLLIIGCGCLISVIAKFLEVI